MVTTETKRKLSVCHKSPRDFFCPVDEIVPGVGSPLISSKVKVDEFEKKLLYLVIRTSLEPQRMVGVEKVE